MEKNVLTGIAVPSLIIFIIAAFANAVIANEKFYSEVGLIIGSAVGIYRFIKMKAQMQQIAADLTKSSAGSRRQCSKKIITVYFINFLLMIILMIITLIKNVWLFIGYIEGIFLLPAGIMLYAVARAINTVRCK